MLAVKGVYLEHGDQRRLDAVRVTLMHSSPGRFQFEATHWWLTQIGRLADEWLDDLFGDKRTYEWDDFAELYRTRLGILGERTDDNIRSARRCPG